jgi:hypothetical protein
MAVHESLEESAVEEKLRIADEEALLKALRLSLDDQDDRVISFDRADNDALESALIRSVYDQGGRGGSGAVVNPYSPAVQQNDEVQSVLSIMLNFFPDCVFSTIQLLGG